MLSAHSILEHDEVRLYHELGHDVFSIGSYIDPAHPLDPKRPPLPDVPAHPELAALITDQMAQKADVPMELLEWADIAIISAFERQWIVEPWAKWNWCLSKGKRVVWRTIGQSTIEGPMESLHRHGLEIVRYSPKERSIPGYAGEDALIRFYKDPAEWKGWNGDEVQVVNVTQGLYQRHPATNWEFWDMATDGLPRTPLGDGSDLIGGRGNVPFKEMQKWLRNSRAYLYTGTQPASYTLGYIEAAMTGIPIVSIGPMWMGLPDLFEVPELAPFSADDPAQAHKLLKALLDDHGLAKAVSAGQRKAAIEMFGKVPVMAAWAAFLGAS